MLQRITGAVGVLQDPETGERPILLREYTEDMLGLVCGDLRQWLDQLATLLSLYHVHLLDLDSERRKLTKLLEEKQAKFDAGEQKKQQAVLRHERIQEQWKEEKMKLRAEALLGITVPDEDALVYSQKDMDQRIKQWEKEHVE